MLIETKVFAGRIKNREVLSRCSSGGAFTALSDKFIDEGNAVLCTGYNYQTNRAEFRLVLTKEERDNCVGSIYVQSLSLDSWKQAEEWLKNNDGKKLIFFGVGCQGAAFRKFCELKGLSDRVTVVDIICHGAPSPLVWSMYVTSLDRQGRIRNINFRDKRDSWNNYISVAVADKKEISLAKWMGTYKCRVMTRDCCGACPYTTIERNTDITIGDFWGMERSMPDFWDKLGTSLFLIHSDKGMQLFECIKDRLEYRESNTTDCLQFNLEHPSPHAADRVDFWRDLRNKGVDFVMDKYGVPTFRRKLQRKVRSILRSR